MFASKTQRDGETYESNQVQRLFISTIESGIDQEISIRIQQYLVPNIKDVELTSQITAAETAIRLRKEKDRNSVQNNRGNTQVNAVSTGRWNDGGRGRGNRGGRGGQQQGWIQPRGGFQPRGGGISTTRGFQPRGGLQPRGGAQLRGGFQQMNRPPPPICNACRDANIQWCFHCFRCGGEGHRSFECNGNAEEEAEN